MDALLSFFKPKSAAKPSTANSSVTNKTVNNTTRKANNKVNNNTTHPTLLGKPVGPGTPADQKSNIMSNWKASSQRKSRKMRKNL